MSDPASTPSGPTPKKHLSPVQLGACLGAAATCLFLLALQDASRPGIPAAPRTPMNPWLLGILSGFGAIAGMALVAVVNLVRRRNKPPPSDGTAAPADERG